MIAKDGLEFSASCSTNTKEISLQYKVKNTGKTTVHLLNRVHRPNASGAPEISKNFIYVYVDGSVPVLEKGIPEIPKGLAPTEPIAPFSTPLRPGATFEETVAISLPLKDSRPYLGGPPANDPVEVREVRFVLGYMGAPEGTTERTMAVGAETVVLFQVPPGTLPTSGQFAVTLPIHSADDGKPAFISAFPKGP